MPFYPFLFLYLALKRGKGKDVRESMWLYPCQPVFHDQHVPSLLNGVPDERPNKGLIRVQKHRFEGRVFFKFNFNASSGILHRTKSVWIEP